MAANRIRVLVVEDSLTVRRRLCEILSAEPDLEVVGEAEDGKRAIELCLALRPDVVTLDMMLPVMSGLAVTEYLMAYCPTPILVVSASVNRGELFRTYDALSAGAVDVFEKPDGGDGTEDWERALVARVRMVARIKVITHPRARLQGTYRVTPGTAPPADRSRVAPRAIAIGASTGGPGALVEILRSLPAPCPLPILLIMHIGAPFGAALVEWLDGQTEHLVRSVRDGQTLREAAGTVTMAPPHAHMVLAGERLRLSDAPERHSCRPSVDVLFESMAHTLGPAATACLLTGMGRDGAEGLLQVRRAGGFTIAQDEASSVVYGMPREAAVLGAAMEILPLTAIGATLASLARDAKTRNAR